MTWNRADPRHFVGGNAHSKTGAANQYAAIGFPRPDQFRNGRGNVRIVHGAAIENAQIHDFAL